jgi:hypothetical protein
MSRELVISRIRDFFTEALAADVFPLEESIRFCRELEPLLVETSTLEARSVALSNQITGFLTKYPATDKPDYRELPTLKVEVAKVQADLEAAKLKIAKLEAERIVIVEKIKEGPIIEPVVEPEPVV